MEPIEEKLKLENEIAALRKEAKRHQTLVGNAKSEYAGIMSVIETNKKVIAEQEKYRAEVQNDISNSKLDWAREKNVEMADLESKEAAAENVLRRKAELNEQEMEIRDLIQAETDTLNELRRMELRVQEGEDNLKARERQFGVEIAEIAKREEKLQADKEEFKKNAVKILAQLEHL